MLACASGPTPETTAQAYLDAVRAKSWLAAADLMHPDEMIRFRTLVKTIAEASPEFRRELFAASSMAELEALDDQQVYARFLETVMTKMPALAQVLSTAETEIVGAVRDGPEKAQVTYRTTLTVAGTSVTKTEVMGLKRRGKGWGALLQADISQLLELVSRASLLKADRSPTQLATSPPPAQAVEADTAPQAEEPAPVRFRGDTSYVRVTVDDIPRFLTRPATRPTVTIFYAVTSPNSKKMFPALVRLAREYDQRTADFLAISTDDAEDAYYIREFLRGFAASFPPLWVEPWAPETLTGAFRSAGVNLGRSFALPVIVVRDPSGRVVGHSEGMTDLASLERYIKGDESSPR